MTLTTHAIMGAAIASLLPQDPVLVTLLAFGSHFVLDAIPHYDYAILSPSIHPRIGAKMKYDSAFFRDAISIGFDGLLGILFSLYFFATSATSAVILLGALAGMLPDPLQFLYTRFKREPLVTLQKFHQWIHTDIRMKNTPFFGVMSQVFFVALVILTAKLLI